GAGQADLPVAHRPDPREAPGVSDPGAGVDVGGVWDAVAAAIRSGAATVVDACDTVAGGADPSQLPGRRRVRGAGWLAGRRRLDRLVANDSRRPRGRRRPDP